MKRRLPKVAAVRLAERRAAQQGPLAQAQAALWQAILDGDSAERRRQSEIIQRIGVPPPDPLVAALAERLMRMRQERQLYAPAAV